LKSAAAFNLDMLLTIKDWRLITLQRTERIFLILTFGITWSVWLLLISSGVSPSSQSQDPIMLLWPLGQFGPLLAVLLLAMWRKFTSFTNMGIVNGSWNLVIRPAKWYLIVFLPLLWIAPACLFAIWISEEQLTISWAALVPVLLSSTLFALGEEVGWRGFLLPSFRSRITPFAASLQLGIIWIVWHMPILYFSVYESSVQFIVFFATYAPTLLLWTFVFTWVYERTNHSLFIVILLHGCFTAAYNVSASLLSASGIVGSLTAMATALIIVVILVIRNRAYWFTPPTQQHVNHKGSLNA
jgi:membrane protease YdiL (CAAX protease family)